MQASVSDESLGLVLVVDDDAAARLLCREALEQVGFEVLEADDGSTALPLFEQRQPDVVVLDVMMRHMNGFEACSRIRQLPSGQHVPILMMTALDDLDSINRAFEYGATDFQPKGMSFALLAYRVQYLLRGKRVGDALRSSEARLAHAQRIARIGHWEWDSEGRQPYYSDSLKVIFGWEQGGDDSYQGILTRVHPEDRGYVAQRIESAAARTAPFGLQHRVLHADGTERVVYHEGEVVAEGTRLRMVGTIQDVTERIETEQRLDYLIYYDTLTNLPNRAFAQQHLERALAADASSKAGLTLLVIDIDHFKVVNDTLGHGVGDDLLVVVAERLRQCVREIGRSAESSSDPARSGVGNTVARLGGDEFVVLLTQSSASNDEAIDCIARAMSAAFRINDKDMHVTASIGVSRYPKDGESADALLRNADAAMHRAKELGRDRHQYYTGSINVRATRRFILDNDLRKAIAEQQLELHYQPKVDLVAQETIGAEALLRWRHPTLGMVSPGEFIPRAEESGLILQIGEWVLSTACAQARAWHDRGFPLHIAVNVSARQFKEPTLGARLRAILERCALPATYLELELTEGVLMEDASASSAILRGLRDIGLKLALDDFGTGYSSLSYLQRFPIDTLKIDRSFVRDIAADFDSATLVKTIIAMAHSLRLRVVAEGVETPEQLAFLKRHECHIAQGYLLGHPLPADEFQQRLVAERARPAERRSG